VSRFLDTSVILGSLDPDERHHAACDRLVAEGGHTIHVHALAETFSILTGGRQGRRLGATLVARLLEESVLPYVQTVSTSGQQMMAALAECESRGVRGGAVYDWLHLAAARRSDADALVTLDQRDFQALSKPGDPRIESP
jgi:predicted nucleic acid-binding protein